MEENKNIDYTIKLSNDLYQVINNSPLPFSVKYFVVKDLFNEMNYTFKDYKEQFDKQETTEEHQQQQTINIPVSVEVVNDEEEENN